MILANIRSLWDVPGLERIQKTCSQHGVHFTAFGSLVRRLAQASWTEQAPKDLFPLVPFFSDIDLIHTGAPELTPTLQKALVHDIPFGECFRWQLRSVKSNSLFWESMKVNNVIPSCLATLSTNSVHGLNDRWDGIRDVQSHSYRFIRNGFYSESPLFRQGRDIELFSVLLYYRVLLEAGLDASELARQPGLEDARRVIAATCSDGESMIRLEESAHMRARLRYLVAALAGAARFGTLDSSMEVLGLDQVVDYLDDEFRIQTVLFPPETLTVTAHIGGNTFRLDFGTPRWKESDDAAKEMEEALGGVQFPPEGEHKVGASLGPGQKVLMASPVFNVNGGISESSHGGADWVQEFLHFALPIDSSNEGLFANLEDEDLSVVAALRGQISNKPVTIFLAPPNVVRFGLAAPGGVDRFLFLRVNCGGLFERIGDIEIQVGTESFGLQLFLLALRSRR